MQNFWGVKEVHYGIVQVVNTVVVDPDLLGQVGVGAITVRSFFHSKLFLQNSPKIQATTSSFISSNRTNAESLLASL